MCIEDIDRKMKYFDVLWVNEIIDRPLINIRAPKKPLLPISYLEGTETGEYLPVLEKAAVNIENTWFGGEVLPFFECSLEPNRFNLILLTAHILQPHEFKQLILWYQVWPIYTRSQVMMYQASFLRCIFESKANKQRKVS